MGKQARRPYLGDELFRSWGPSGFPLAAFTIPGSPTRHIVVDTLGNLLDVVVHAANIQDYHGAKHVLRKVTETVNTLQRIWADGMYEKDGLVEWVRNTLHIALDVVKRPPDQQGFVVVPRRWGVERSFAWLGRYRRLSKDYARCTRSSEGMIYIASLHTMLRRIPA